ncbi:MAG: hypothetical protein CL471_05055 [Acidobacteria bacterium]|jgi:hypothetical protein|nr:hypothetical protein [Acidobacteriota bacterium]
MFAWAGRAGAQPALYPSFESANALGEVADLTFSPDGRLLAAVGSQGYGVWDSQTGDLVRTGSPPVRDAQRITFGASGNVLALGGRDGRVWHVDLLTGSVSEVARHGEPVTALAFGRGGTIGASGDEDGGLFLWDSAAGAVIGELTREGHEDEILGLAFDAMGRLTSLDEDFQVITWDVAGQRAVRRSTLQLERFGARAFPSAASFDPTGGTAAFAGQYVSAPRGGVVSRGGRARPQDLERVNVIVSYATETGLASDPVRTGEFRQGTLALSPGGCFAFFTSTDRGRARLHTWSLVEQGDDLVRLELGEVEPTSLKLAPNASNLVVGMETGTIRTWRVSGATLEDCNALRAEGVQVAAGPEITLGSEGSPLIPASSGYRLAVLHFEVGGVEPFLGDAVAEMVTGELSNSPDVVVAERAAIEAIVQELEIQRSGLTAEDAVRIGRGLNAQKVILGSLRRFGEDTYVLLARMVDVETQRIEGTREIICRNCEEDDLPNAVRALSNAIAR